MALEKISVILSTTLKTIGHALSVPQCRYFDTCTSKQYGCEGSIYDEEVCQDAAQFRATCIPPRRMPESENNPKI